MCIVTLPTHTTYQHTSRSTIAAISLSHRKLLCSNVFGDFDIVGALELVPVAVVCYHV